MPDSAGNIVVQEIARHQSRLRGFLRCLLVNPGDIDDLLQEINAVLWEKREEFRPGTDFWAWASQVARYKVLNHVRKRTREQTAFDMLILERLADVAASKLETLNRRREALEHCLGQLPPAQRQLLDLRYAEGRPSRPWGSRSEDRRARYGRRSTVSGPRSRHASKAAWRWKGLHHDARNPAGGTLRRTAFAPRR